MGHSFEDPFESSPEHGAGEGVDDRVQSAVQIRQTNAHHERQGHFPKTFTILRVKLHHG